MSTGQVAKSSSRRSPRTLPHERRRNDRLSRAVHRNRRMSKEGLRERLFTLAFRGLVYPQIWEDPVVDMEALDIQPGQHLVTIASGGCNVLSYLVADPGKVTAVDLNRAHIAFNRMKITALKQLPSYEAFHRFFGSADSRANVRSFRQYIEPNLDPKTRDYWRSRDLLGRRRINFFKRNIYRYGLLGTFIGAGHFIARLHGRNPRRILDARDPAEQREFYERELAPLFRKRHIRWLVNNPVSLYGLGIPPAQFKALLGDTPDMAMVLANRLEKLACDFPLTDNYFAWQAFGRQYPDTSTGALPPYLQRDNYEDVKLRAERVDIRHISMTELLASQPNDSVDRVVLLDAQDWMTPQQLTDLWREITRTARPGARVLFRTAAAPSLLPGQVPNEILDRWDYREAESLDYTKRDRSAIYGGVHLYEFKNEDRSA